MKKNLLFAICCAIVSLSADADTVKIDDVWYELNPDDMTCAVACQFDNTSVEGTGSSQYQGMSGDFTVPETVEYDEETYAVVSLADGAFKNEWNLTSVVVPSTITSMGTNTFSGSHVRTVTLPATLAESLPDYTFNDCEYLTAVYIADADGEQTEICSSDKVRQLGDYCFYNCIKYDGLAVPAGAVKLGSHCYAKCTTLAELELPEGLEETGDYCFYSCTHLTSVNVPATVTTLGDYCFEDCTRLASVSLSESLSTLSAYCFSGCTALESIILPEELTELGMYCFNHCSALTSVDLPAGVTTLGDYCFYYSGLETVTLPKSVTSLGKYCFADCSNLVSVSLPGTITELPDDCFNYCSALPSVFVPEGITTIDRYCFARCEALADVVLPSTLTSVGIQAFNNCNNLTTVTSRAITPPELLTSSNTYKNFPTDLGEDCTLYVPEEGLEAYQSSDWARYFSLFVAMPYVDIDPADGEERMTLDSITFSHNPIYVDWNVWDETAIAVYDANGRLVTQGKTGSHTETTNDEGDTTSVTIALDTTLKEAGEYTISLPDRFFYNDAEGTLPVMAFTSVVVVTGDVRDNLGVSPADGDTVDELFEITFTCSPIALVDDADVSQITVSFGEETVAHGNPDGITQDDNTISVALDSSLVQQGVYTVNIPEGLFLLDENGTISNYAISLTVNVSGLLDGINTVETIGVGGIIEVYNLSGQRINAPVSKRVNIVRRADGSVRKVITR